MFIVRYLISALLFITLTKPELAHTASEVKKSTRPIQILNHRLQTIPLPLPKYYKPYTIEFGNPQASLVIHKFFAFSCPSCLAFHERFFSTIENEYIKTGKVKWIFVPYALDIDTLTILILLPRIPKNKQLPVFNKLMQESPNWSTGNNKQLIFRAFKEFGITEKELNTIYKEHKKITLNEAFKIQQEILIDGTPTFFLNGKELPGIPTDKELSKYIQQTLKEQ